MPNAVDYWPQMVAQRERERPKAIPNEGKIVTVN